MAAFFNRVCEHCAAVSKPGDVRHKHCALCQDRVYCSKACQIQDWKDGHANLCICVEPLSALEEIFEHCPELFVKEIVARLSTTDVRLLSCTSRTLAPITSTISRDTEYHANEFMDTELRAQWALENGCHLDERLCAAAAAGGHLAVLKYLRKVGCPWNEDVCEFAAGNNHATLLRWARLQDCPWNGMTCASAAGSRNFEILRWAHENGCPWNANTCARAAFSGHLEMLQWARANGCTWCSGTCRSAAEAGHFDILKWASKEGCPLTPMVFEGAAFYGDIEVLNWLRGVGCVFDSFSANFAAQAGHVAVLDWIEERFGHMIHNFESSSEISASAAEHGCTAVLSWVLTNEYPIDVSVFDLAARHGHLDTLIWLHVHVRSTELEEEGEYAAIQDRVCVEAARGGHLDVLQWILANGGSITLPVFGAAALGGNLRVLKWLVQHSDVFMPGGLQYGCAYENLCAKAAESGNVAVLRWLREYKYPWDKTVYDTAAHFGHTTLLQWAWKHKCPFDSNVLLHAAKGGRLEIVKWAFEQGRKAHGKIADDVSVWDALVKKASLVACQYGHAEVFSWFLQNGCAIKDNCATEMACKYKHLYLSRQALNASLGAKEPEAKISNSDENLKWMAQDLEDLYTYTAVDDEYLDQE